MNNPKCFDENNLGFLYKYIPIKDKNIIQFYWVLPYTVKNYKS